MISILDYSSVPTSSGFFALFIFGYLLKFPIQLSISVLSSFCLHAMSKPLEFVYLYMFSDRQSLSLYIQCLYNTDILLLKTLLKDRS